MGGLVVAVTTDAGEPALPSMMTEGSGLTGSLMNQRSRRPAPQLASPTAIRSASASLCEAGWSSPRRNRAPAGQHEDGHADRARRPSRTARAR